MPTEKQKKLEKISVEVDGNKYTLGDMRNWFIQIRSFHSILYFGKGKNQVAGEGQYGGSNVSETAHAAEKKFVQKLGIDKYRGYMDELMKGHENENGGGMM